MRDENGNDISDKDLLLEAMNLLSDACCLLFETKHDEVKALAFMVDSALKYAQVIREGDNPLEASADYAAYENKVFNRKRNGLRVIK